MFEGFLQENFSYFVFFTRFYLLSQGQFYFLKKEFPREFKKRGLFIRQLRHFLYFIGRV